jgi:hypothetical protein
VSTSVSISPQTWSVRPASSSSLLFGAGAGMMNVPLTNAVLQSMPPKQSGVASALLNASREVAGLLGITIIGAVLRSRQGAAARHGANPAVAYLDGYHSGLLVTVTLIAFGALISYGALRRATRQVPAAQPVLAAAANPGSSGEPELVRELAGRAPELARESAGR